MNQLRAVTLLIFFVLVCGQRATAASISSGGRTTIGTSVRSNIPRNFWTFDGKHLSGTTLTDAGTTKISGTLTGGVTPIRGKIGQALKFDGTSGFVDLGTANPLAAGSGTVVAWVRLHPGIAPSACTSNYIISKGTDVDNNAWGLNYCFVNDTTVYPSLYYAAGAGGRWVDSDSISTDPYAWHQLVAVMRSSGTQELYFDGASVKTGSLSAITPTAGAALTIGKQARGSPWQYFANADIDDVRIYSQELTSAQIASLYTAVSGTKVSPPTMVTNVGITRGLVGWWTFDGGKMNATQALDSSGNGYVGTLSGQTSKLAGPQGQALKFDGETGFVTTTFDRTVTSATFTAWINTSNANNTTHTGIVFSRSTDVTGINFYSSNQLGYTWNDSSLTYNWASGLTVPANTWVFVAVAVEPTQARVYMSSGNSLLTASNSVTHTSTRINSLLLARDSFASRYFPGALDDVRIYDRALSASEITQLYNLNKKTSVTRSVPATGITRGLVGWWTFDGGKMNATQALDSSGNGYAGTLNGQISKLAGPQGQALSFDGSSSYISMGQPSRLDITGPMTISAWVYPKKLPVAFDDYYSIVEKGWDGSGQQYYLRFANEGTTGSQNALEFGYYRGGAKQTYYVFGSNIVTNNWYHLVGIFTGTAYRLYVNGINVSSTNNSTAPISNNRDVVIAAASGTGGVSQYFQGNIDDVRIYDRALSDAEVLQLYNATKK